VKWHSLQIDEPETSGKLTERFPELVDCSPEIHDFADTAAWIENLDLVISVDTATAHLAGALGKPTWVLLPFAADWRWQENRDDSIWYPQMRLFRQKQADDWQAPLEEVLSQLQQFVK
jgi:ADP-heptose:LPS heptosyltransferase